MCEWGDVTQTNRPGVTPSVCVFHPNFFCEELLEAMLRVCVCVAWGVAMKGWVGVELLGVVHSRVGAGVFPIALV